jgi:glucose/arabinose dehydrogenase
MKRSISLLAFLMFISTAFSQTNVVSGRMNEVFRYTTLVPNSTNLRDPWEITYGPDDSLWVTEASAGTSNGAGTAVNAGSTGYKVRKIHPTNGGIRTILDLMTFSDPASTPTTKWRKTFTPGLLLSPQPSGSTNFKVPSFQGGLMGLAIHPEYMTNPAKRFVYLAYGHSYIPAFDESPRQTTNPITGEVVQGDLFVTWLVRFYYDGSQLVNPVAMCDTIPGSNDHNSGRMIINYEGGTPYLYYAMGDVGAGQFSNVNRTIKSQLLNSYEGKILRFNLEEDGDADQGTVDYNRWIPNTNPYNVTLGVQSAVWAIGIRNNQGFAAGNVNGFDRFYGASHGPHSDDEVNLIQSAKNYGHPLVIGYSTDGNYNNAKAGPTNSSLPFITSESANATAIGSTYVEPMYSNYAAPAGVNAAPYLPYYSIQAIYHNPSVDTDGNSGNGIQSPQSNNGMWWSEGYSGLGLYTGNAIPGWKNSLLLASLKWGRVVRMKLNADGSDVENGGAGGMDTISYFGGTNRFRDVAIHANGKDIYIVMDRSTSSSGPSASNPIVPACGGCVQRYEFLGYSNVSGTSAIPTTVGIEAGTLNNCVSGNPVTVNALNNNNNIWVPITGPDGNIIAEINANGNDIGVVNSSIYVRNNATQREDDAFRPYSNRNVTISLPGNPTINPANPVRVRIYMTTAEYNALRLYTNSQGQPSTIAGTSNLALFKNNDPCGNSIHGSSTKLTTTAYTHGSFGYALQADVTSFSTFYVSSSSFSTLPVTFAGLSGKAQGDASVLTWNVSNEERIKRYIVERSVNRTDFERIGSIVSKINNGGDISYNFTDPTAASLGRTIYYRIVAEGEDATEKLSNTIAVKFDPFANASVSVFPNPVKNRTTITVVTGSDDKAQIRVIDNTGRTVFAQPANLVSGTNNLSLNLEKLPAGLYHVEVIGKTINQKTKLIKQ